MDGDVAFWPEATVRCDAAIRLQLGEQRTWRRIARNDAIDPQCSCDVARHLWSVGRSIPTINPNDPPAALVPVGDFG